MRKLIPAFGVLALLGSSAVAADMKPKMVTKAPPPPVVSPWDLAFGGGIASDYNFRGISQSDHGPSPFAYFEPRYNFSKDWQAYIGIAGYGTKLPTTPTAEIDFYGGIRPTFGPLALDLGFIYYYYPRERQIDGVSVAILNGATTLADTDFWEVYGKATYTFNETFSIGGNVYYSPDWLNSGAPGTYASGTAKINLPALFKDVGWYVSGEAGHYWLGTTKFDLVAFPVPLDLPDYTTWNVGLAFTYKVFTLDLRYYDTDLSKENCFILTADPGGSFGGTPINPGNAAGVKSNWCGSAFIAKLSADLTLDSLK